MKLSEEVELKIRELIFSWRWIHALNLLINIKSDVSVREEILHELVHKLVPGLAKEKDIDLVVLDCIKAHSSMIRYAYWDNTVKWRESHFVPGIGVDTHKNMPLEDYSRAMIESKNTLRFNKENMKIMLHGKSVLDFGCGFFTMVPQFRDAGVNYYHGVDKPDVFQRYFFMQDKMTIEQHYMDACVDRYLGERFSMDFSIFHADGVSNLHRLISFCRMSSFDVIWLSEILHSKDMVDNAVLLTILKEGLRHGGIMCIVEPRRGTPEGVLFDLQMLVHCGVKHGLVGYDRVVNLCNRTGLRMKIVHTDVHPIYNIYVVEENTS